MSGQYGTVEAGEALLTRCFKRIDEETASSFSPVQRAALVRMFGTPRETSSHAVDVRGAVGRGRVRFYFVLQAGGEKRSSERLRSERRGSVLSDLVFSVLFSFFILAAALGVYFTAKNFFSIGAF